MVSRVKLLRFTLGFGSCLSAGAMLKAVKCEMSKNEESDQSSVSKLDQIQRDIDDMELKMVQIFIRHGARTPLHTIKNVKEVTYEKKKILATVPHTNFTHEVLAVDGGPRPFSQYEAFYKDRLLKGGARVGTLTTTGQEQMYLKGKQLYTRYRQHNLIDDRYDPSQIYIRSTNVSRTILTARCVLAGMYGHQHLNSLQDSVKIYIGESADDFLLPRTSVCHVLRQINHASMIHGGDLPEMKPTREKLEKLLGIEGDPHKMNFIDLRDDIIARQTHGFQTPEVLEPYNEEIEKNASTLMFYAFCGVHEGERELAKRLSTGPLLSAVLDNIQQAHNNSTRLYLYSCHDSTLIPLLGTLGVYDFKWPPFGSDITFELWEDQAKKQFVRVMYNGKAQVIQGSTMELCPLDEFKDTIRPYLIDKREYKELCASNILDIIAKEMMEQEKGEVEDTETAERSDLPAGM